MHHLRLVPLLCLGAAIWSADLLPGESLGQDLLGPSGLDAAVAARKTPFVVSPDAGATSTVESGPDGARFILEEGSGGPVGNRGATMRWELSGDVALLNRINEILARPVGQPPISMVFACRLQRLAASSHSVGMQINGLLRGRGMPGRLFLGDTDMRRLPGYTVGGPAITVDERLVPGFRFQLPATGGAQHADIITFSFDMRVEGGASPERIAVDRCELREIAGPPLIGANGTLATIGGAPPPGLLAAARRAGWTVLPAADTADGIAADLYVVERRIDNAQLAAPLIAALDAGRSVLLSIPGPGRVERSLEERLPANSWSWASGNLVRADGLAVAEPGGAWSAMPGSLPFGYRYDLHLPGAPIENGLMRYQWELYGKGPLVSDWRSELAIPGCGGLPLLATARSGAGRAAVLAADLADPVLGTAPAFAACCDGLLAWARPQAVAPTVGDAAALTLDIPPCQPDGLSVIVRNPGKAVTGAVLSWKTSSWGHEFVTARSTPISVPAGGRIAVPLADAAPAGAIPWRRIDAAILPADRSRIATHAVVGVCLSRPVELAIRSDAAEDPWPGDQARAADDLAWCDGRLATRYVYSTGATPHLTVIARNGRTNLAPLATAKDLGFPANPTINGLNDLSWSTANVRNSGPWQGGWSGRPAAEQRLELTWPTPVTVVGQRLGGYGPFRRWSNANPLHHQVLQPDGKPIFTTAAAAFAGCGSDLYAYCDEDFASPTTLSGCTLLVTGLDPRANPEPHHLAPSNCSIQEWEVLGWPGSTPPPTATGDLVVTATDLLTNATTELLRERVSLAAGTEQARQITLPAHPGFGPVRVDVGFAGTTTALDCVFVQPGTGLVAKASLADGKQGLLCSPGFTQTIGFGLGMRSQTQGWGGDDDKIWALTHNMMECGSRNRDAANRLFTTDARFCHYTSPFRNTAGGSYGWDLAADAILQRAIREKKTRFHVIGSDRWNGIPIGMVWGWDQYLAFDSHLRSAGGPGLRARSRAAIAQEISEQHGDAWQRWQMERYAGKMLATKAAFAKAGKVFSFESHGSFPLCGGTIGAELAATHRSVGTDLFWELRNQDLFYAIGTRFGLVAANPSLESGAYGQWGWVNSDCNQWWFANNSGIDPARRQWYATYFTGRVTLDGAYAPYHMTGFSMQGGVGTQVYADDIAACVRTEQLTARIRPEAPAGCILAISWAEQERHMGPRTGAMGFGLYADPGHEQIDMVFAHAYDHLIKAGMPIATITAAEALPKWGGSRPLILADGFAWGDDQLAEVARLNRAGAPVLLLGDADEVQGTAAAALCGVRRDGDGWAAATGTERLELPGGPLFIRAGRAPVAWCPLPLRSLPASTAQAVADAFLSRIGDPLRLAPGVVCTPLVSQDRLWLPLCDLGDRTRDIEVAVVPSWFVPRLTGAVQAIDLDSGTRLPARFDAASGRLRFTVNLPGTGGRMILIDTAGR